MADVVSVVIQAKSDGIDSATKSLNNLTQAAANAEAATGSLSSSTNDLTSSQNTSSSSIDKLLQQMQKRADLLGTNVAQQNAYNAALKGATAAQQSMATFLGAEVDAFKALSAAQTEANRMNAQFTQAQQASTQAAQAFLNNLNDMVAKTTLSGQALKDYNAGLLSAKAAQLGVSDEAARMIASLQQTGTAAEGAHTGIAGITRELIVVGHEAMTGNFSRIPGSMVVLAEKVNLSTIVVGGLTAATDALGISMTTLLVGGAAVIIALGTLAAAAVQAHNDYVMFRDAVFTSGNLSGTTVAGLNSISEASVKMGGSLSYARQTAADLATTGKFSASQIALITPALTEADHVSSTAAEGFKKSFTDIGDAATNTSARSSDAVTRAVLTMNAQYDLLTTKQMENIKSLDEQGQHTAAAAAAYVAMADAIASRSQQAADNFTPLGKAIDAIAKKAQDAWNNVKQLFATQQGGEAQQMASLQSQLAAAKAEQTTGVQFGEGSPVDPNQDPNKISKLNAQILALQNQMDAESLAALRSSEASKAALKQQFDENALSATIKANDSQYAAQQALTQAELQWANSTDDYKLQHQAEYNVAHENLVKATQDKVKALGLSGIDAQLKQIDQVAQAQIDADNTQLQSLQDLYNAKRITPQEYVDKSTVLVLDEAMASSTKFADSISAVNTRMAMSNTTVSEANQLTGKIADITKANDKAMAAYNITIDKNNNLIGNIQQKAVDDQNKQNEKTNEGIQKQIDALNAQAAAYNNLPDAVKAAGVSEKQMQDAITQQFVDALQIQLTAAQDSADAMTKLGQAQITGLKEQIDLLGQKAQAQKDVEATQAANKAITDYNTKWKEANKQIGDDLASAIVDGGGKGWKKLITDMETAFAKVILQPILAPISSSLASLTTTVGASSPVGAGVGDASSAISTASTLSSIYNTVSKGLSTAATTLGGAITSVGNFFGSEGVSSFGTGLTLTTEQAATAAAAYGEGTVATGLTSGAMAGAITTAASGIAAGVLGGELISGQYGSKNAVYAGAAAGAAIGSVVPVLGTAVGAVVGGIIGGIGNRLFGMGNKTVTSTGIEGTLSTSGVTGDAYATWAQSGGLFRSDKSGIDKSALPDATANSLSAGLTTLMTTAEAAAKSLGVSTDSLANFSTAFNIVLTGDTTKDTAAITAFLSGVSDTIATDIVPNIATFAQSGETATQTLQRLADTFSATDAVAQLLGKDTSTAFGAVGLASASTRQALVDLAGGITTLQSETQYFATNFETAAEQVAPAQKAVTDAMAALGESSVTTIAQYDDLVKGIDLSTTAGQELFQNLMALAPSFKAVADAAATAAAAAQKITDQQHTEDENLLSAQNNAQGLLNAQRADELAALDLLDPALETTQKQIYAITDAATAFTNAQKATSSAFDVVSAAVTAAKNAATDAYNAQTTVINNQITAVTAVNTAIGNLASSVQSALNSMLTATATTLPTLASANAQLDNALSQAKAGTYVDSDSLTNAFSTLTKDNSNLFSSSVDYQESQGVTAGKLADLNTLTSNAKTTSDKQLDTLNASLVTLKSSYDTQNAGFDQLLASAQLQLDAVNGTNVAIMSITDALNAFNASVTSAIAAAQGQATAQGSTTSVTSGQSGGVPATTADIVADYKNILGRDPTDEADGGAGLAYWEARAAAGATASEIAAEFYASPEYATINGSHANGLDNVPFDGYTAKLHKGEMVLPASSAQSVRTSGTNDDVVAAIKDTMATLQITVDGQASDITWLRQLFNRMSPNKNGLNTYAQTL